MVLFLKRFPFKKAPNPQNFQPAAGVNGTVFEAFPPYKHPKYTKKIPPAAGQI